MYQIDLTVESIFRKFDRQLIELTGKDEPPQIDGSKSQSAFQVTNCLQNPSMHT